MKEEIRDMEMVAYAPSPPATSSVSTWSTPSAPLFPIPVGPARRRSTAAVHNCLVVLRLVALIFSFVSAFSLASSPKKQDQNTKPSFTQYSELMYCFIVSLAAFVYSALKLFKAVCDFAHRGILVSDMASDYLSFVLDQLVGYLLISASSVTISVIGRLEKAANLRKAAVVSASASFASFIVIAICGLFSGYKLYKRIE